MGALLRSPHMTRAALLGLAALVVASPAYADIKFVGQSRATPQLKRDVLTVIAGYAQARHACGTITTVESAPLGDKYEPKTPLYRVAEAGHLYERWVAELCGTKRAFLVALWPSPKGGADYKVVEVPPGTDP
jgi:hypothetical protein